MRTLHLLELELPMDDGMPSNAVKFRREYATNSTGPVSFLFSDGENVKSALAVAATLNLPARHFYVFDLRPQELASHPAVYFGAEAVYDLLGSDGIDPANLEDRELAMDYATERIIASPRVVKLLAGSAPAIKWTPVNSIEVAGWSALAIHESLPDPIFIPYPVEFGQNEGTDDRYWIRSDGRDVISDTNVAILSKVDLAASHSGRTPAGTFKWRRRLIASGKVMGLLTAANIRGLVRPLTPLLPESHSLSHPQSGKDKNT